MATDWFAGREIGTALAILGASWPIRHQPLVGRACRGSRPPYRWAAALAAAPVMAALAIVLVAIGYRGRAGLPRRYPRPRRREPALSAREFGLVSLAGGIGRCSNVGYILVVSFAPSLLVARGDVGDGGRARDQPRDLDHRCHHSVGRIVTDRTGRSTALMPRASRCSGSPPC